jgi:hypothetical protein
VSHAVLASRTDPSISIAPCVSCDTLTISDVLSLIYSAKWRWRFFFLPVHERIQMSFFAQLTADDWTFLILDVIGLGLMSLVIGFCFNFLLSELGRRAFKVGVAIVALIPAVFLAKWLLSFGSLPVAVVLLVPPSLVWLFTAYVVYRMRNSSAVEDNQWAPRIAAWGAHNFERIAGANNRVLHTQALVQHLTRTDIGAEEKALVHRTLKEIPRLGHVVVSYNVGGGDTQREYGITREEFAAWPARVQAEHRKWLPSNR